MTNTIELQLHEVHIDGAYVHVAYSLVSDIAVTDITKRFSKIRLTEFVRHKGLNEYEVDGYLYHYCAETYFADNLRDVVSQYIMEDNR